MGPVPDHIRPGLQILFIGFNPSLRSSEAGHHYANPANRFWAILYRAGITPRRYSPAEDYRLLELAYGLTNIVSRPTRAAADILPQEYEQGRLVLMEKIRRYTPRVACFVGKGVYTAYARRRDVAWGVQAEPVVPGVIDFVAPSSSGLVTLPPDAVVAIYSQLKSL